MSISRQHKTTSSQAQRFDMIYQAADDRGNPVDFSWVRQLAEQSNQHELDKQAKERQRQEEERLKAMATLPFVDKLFMLFQACCEEFNKHTMFAELRVTVSRITKKSKGPDSQIPDEIAYFTFTRKSWMYGVRGINGTIEFVELPVTEGAGSLNMKLDEIGVDSNTKLLAKVEGDPQDVKKKQVVWTLNDEIMDGPKLIGLCQNYFSEFIRKTND